MTGNDIQDIERQIFELNTKLRELRREAPRTAVADYRFDSIDGEVSLSELFAGKDRLLAIHNMGQGCRYCTLWGDGINGFVTHLESAMSMVMLSKDDPQTQRRFANSRNWRFRMASHDGGAYIKEQTVMDGAENMPGAVFYERDGDKIYRKNACVFGPGDLYCSMWSFLGLAGLSDGDFTPQFNYWQRPEMLDDGGEDVIG